ncbi:interferon-inducible GTPase 5-like [Pelodiscus sinensis]|uniref:interferon-inducible GTPase 5-like n=1 Tax=Pelodiscus sinensis TaxID=13735 RepID=UPI003F6D50C7
MSTEEFKAAVKTGDLSKAVSIAKMILSRCYVAVIGESGSGVSSLIHAITDLKNNDEGAAKTGTFQTTREKESYVFPSNPRVTLWDLPGIGTCFKESQNLEKAHLSHYDFFIIIAAERCTAIHFSLAREIQKMGKGVCFVRSKVDKDLDNERKKKDYSEEKTLDQIRKDFNNRLQTAGIDCTDVFLTSIRNHDKYDLPGLKTYISSILSRHTEMLFTISRSVLQEKKKAIQGTTWRPGALGLGLSVAFIFSKEATAAIVADCMRDYCKDFGLHDSSLEAIANQTRKRIRDLTDVMKTPLASTITYADIKTKMENRAGSGLYWWLPVFSSGYALIQIQEVLDAFVADLADDAQSVLTEALQ